MKFHGAVCVAVQCVLNFKIPRRRDNVAVLEIVVKFSEYVSRH